MGQPKEKRENKRISMGKNRRGGGQANLRKKRENEWMRNS